MNVGILFGLVRSLVRLVQPCSMYILVFLGGGGISTLVQMVRPYSVYVGILFGL